MSGKTKCLRRRESLDILLYDNAHQPCFLLFSYLPNVNNIARRTRNKTYTSLILGKNRDFRNREFNFVERFNGDFVANSYKSFETDRR